MRLGALEGGNNGLGLRVNLTPQPGAAVDARRLACNSVQMSNRSEKSHLNFVLTKWSYSEYSKNVNTMMKRKL